MIGWKEFKILNNFQKKAVSRYNDIMIAREFWWSEKQILETSQEFYDDIILILQKENALQKSKKNNKK